MTHIYARTAAVYSLVLLSLAVSACGPTIKPNYLKGRETLLKRVLTEEELKTLKKNFDQNPEQYTQELFNSSLAKMHQICAPFAKEYAQTPEINDGINPAEAKATWNIYNALNNTAKKSEGIPADLFEEKESLDGYVHKIIMEWQGRSNKGNKKDLWAFIIGNPSKDRVADGGKVLNTGAVLNIESIGFEQGEDEAYLEDGILKGKCWANSKDSDGIIVTISHPKDKPMLFYFNKKLQRARGRWF